ncbi:MAG: hypothetical protein K6F70_09335 [Eggerthellaceae bacterium]|nr:hypothetical protein [Eggerthellaceae bacterium]
MQDETAYRFDYGLERQSEYDPFDAPDDFTDDAEAEVDGALPPAPTRPVGKISIPDRANAAKDPQERIADLFERFATRRRVLLGILKFVRERRSAADVRGEVDRLQEYDYSVYVSANLCLLLEEAGAIVKVEEDGTPFSAKMARAPEVVVIDDAKYYKPLGYRPVFWELTDDGAAVLEAESSADRVGHLFDEESRYVPVYQRILLAGMEPEGIAMAKLNAMLMDDPLLQNPRYYASRFLQRLERCDAMVWEGAWKTTEVGKAAVEKVASASTAAKEGE